jgi:phage terminase large subunit GpA-like protein
MNAIFQPLYNAARASYETAAAVLEPPPPADFNAWAVANVVFGNESSIPGPYNPDLFAFFRRPLEVLGPDHPCREVVMAKSAQLGGTVLAQIFMAAAMDIDPGNFLYVHPTEDNAVRWVKTKWRPMLRQVNRAREAEGRPPLLGTDRSRSGDQSILYQERADGRGSLIISGANSEASLSMISVSRQVQDDLAKWTNNDAGDPETQSDSRSKAFSWAKILKIGTPLVEGECRVTKAFQRSTQEYFHVPCPHCDAYQPLEWDNMLATLDEERPEDAHFTCIACQRPILQRHRAPMVARGRWVASNPNAWIVGFHLWSAYSPLEPWPNIARAWLNARGDPESQQAFFNDTLGKPYRKEGEAPPWQDLRARSEKGYDLGIVPPGALLLTLGVDSQGDRVEWQLVGWGRNRRRWIIDHGVIDGNITTEACRTELSALVNRKWETFQRRHRAPDQLAIDAGGHFAQETYSWAKLHPRSQVMVVRGSRFDNAPPLQQRKTDEVTFRGKPSRAGIKAWWVGVSSLKGALYEDLRKDDATQRGHIALPKGITDDFLQQLCGERRIAVRKRNGYTAFEWMKDPGQRVEMLDCHLYAEAAAIRINWRGRSELEWDRLETERQPTIVPGLPDHDDPQDLFQHAETAPAPAQPAPVRPEPAAPAPAMRRRSWGAAGSAW